MTKYVLDNYAGPELDYSTLGFRANVGDILDATGAPDARWSVNANQAAAETVDRYTIGGFDPAYVEPTDGHFLVYRDVENGYVPEAPETALAGPADTIIASRINDPVSATAAALSATIASETVDKLDRSQPLVVAPDHLAKWRKRLAEAMFVQTAIEVEGDSIAAGRNSNNAAVVTLADVAIARARGWAAQFRAMIAQQFGIDPGEGHVFLAGGDEGRWTYTGGTPATTARGPIQSGVRMTPGMSAAGSFRVADLRVVFYSPGQTGHLPRIESDGVDVRSTLLAAGGKEGTVSETQWDSGNDATCTVTNGGTRAITATAVGAGGNLRAFFRTLIDVTAGQRVAATTHITSTIVGRSVAVEIQWLLADGTTAVGAAVTTNATSTINGTNGVTSFFTVPATATKGRVCLIANGYTAGEAITFKDMDVLLVNDAQQPNGVGNMGWLGCTTLTDADHTITVSAPLTGVADVANLFMRRRTDAGVLVHQVGKSGSTAAVHAGDGLSANDAAAMFAATFDYPNTVTPVGLRIIALGTNEFSTQAYAPATYRTHLSTLITKAKAKGECVLLVAGSRYSSDGGKTWPEETYYAEARDLAKTTADVAFIDLADSWGNLAHMAALGFRDIPGGLGIHPTLAGHGDYARMMFDAVTRQPITAA